MTFPALCLFLFTSKSRAWFVQLLKHGRVPHGTAAYAAVRREVAHVQDLKLCPDLSQSHLRGVPLAETAMFDVAHSK
jgi:hypothetical protein